MFFLFEAHFFLGFHFFLSLAMNSHFFSFLAPVPGDAPFFLGDAAPPAASASSDWALAAPLRRPGWV